MSKYELVMVTIQVPKYKCTDGRTFDTQAQCEDYEERKAGNRVTCSYCRGAGQTEPDPMLGWSNQGMRTCSDCQGRGYLTKVTKYV